MFTVILEVPGDFSHQNVIGLGVFVDPGLLRWCDIEDVADICAQSTIIATFRLPLKNDCYYYYRKSVRQSKALSADPARRFTSRRPLLAGLSFVIDVQNMSGLAGETVDATTPSRLVERLSMPRSPPGRVVYVELGL